VTHCSVSRSLSCPMHHSLLTPHLFIPTHTHTYAGVVVLLDFEQEQLDKLSAPPFAGCAQCRATRRHDGGRLLKCTGVCWWGVCVRVRVCWLMYV
jgi:hypothetical protein